MFCKENQPPTERIMNVTETPATLTRKYRDMLLRAGNCIGLVPWQYRAARTWGNQPLTDTF